MPCTIQQVLSKTPARLIESLALDTSSARIEVQSLLQHVMNVSRAYLLAHPERCLTDSEQARYETLLGRRMEGDPFAYILGEREFFGLLFKVTRATLIPRPETELLVEMALQRIPKLEPFRVLDLGTGSGAIALSIAHSRPDAEVVAIDISSEALSVAFGNAERLDIHNTVFLQSEWYSALNGQGFDLIVSNPPYVAEGDPHLLQGDLRFEPATALASGSDGLRDIRSIVSGALPHLTAGGWLLLEHGYDQASRVRELLRQSDFNNVFSACDLSGIQRVTGGRA